MAPPSIHPSALHAVQTRLIARAVASNAGEAIVTELCEGLIAARIPLWRFSLSVPAIDPLLRGMSLAWRRGEGLALFPAAHGPEGEKSFADSPIAWLKDNDREAVRWRLDGAEVPNLPLLAELRAAGATDYLLHLVGFAPGSAIEGAGLSFATDRAGGFAPDELDALSGLVPTIALATAKLTVSHTLREVASTYLGPAAAERVLSGETRRGQSAVVPAAILLVDLRGFTALADRDDPLKVVGWLDEHFDALGKPVRRHGGEILKFLGDGFLAVFSVAASDAPACPACAGALAAAQEALARNDALNAGRRRQGLPVLEADIVLHFGPVVYGNVGTDRRLDFTVIGRAVNEASRIERLCDALERPLLISDAFARRCAAPLTEVGAFELRGIERAQRVWALPQD
ncbi:adenylyl cyclase [Methylobacterium sp. Leaf456]|uniref:adenylate/guanylate cyclase domain-containing protein n=1 Tax=Methylobacterium sp. Leaf456 TaxID=1736382 RepID=UPI0006F54167|nr:adenylate/guanylate cyclase domain-containing protein [Methylobacterium sp. Leaf456]KQT49938.1 adenylyl cyclase [Methylobacterium sp. Leaf456]